MSTRLAPDGIALAVVGVALAVAAAYPVHAVAPLEFAAHFVADALPGASGSDVTAWPNAGTGGSQLDLLAHGPAPTLLRGAAPNGHDCVRMPASSWLQTAAAGPLSGTQERCLWAVVRVSSLVNQDVLEMGRAQPGEGCGLYEYENSGGGSWTIYGYGNSVRPLVVGEWALLFWRGRVEGTQFSVYTRGNESPDPQSPPVSFVNTYAGAPLTLGQGHVFGFADQLDVAEAGVDTVFPEGYRWQLFKNRLLDRYGLAL